MAPGRCSRTVCVMADIRHKLRPMLLAACLLLVLGARAQCPPGNYQAVADNILVVTDEVGYPGPQDVQWKLMNTYSFSAVDSFDADVSTPTMDILSAYDSVLVFTYNGGNFNSPDFLGDILAAYHDRGGGVVVAYGANCGRGLSRAYAAISNGYALLDYSGGCSDGGDGLENFSEPSSPLLAGICCLEAVWAGRSSGQPVPGVFTVAKWRSGAPLVLRGVRNNRTLVELNFSPPSITGQSDSWIGDWAALMRNALKYS